MPKTAKDQIWERANPIRGKNPAAWRKDAYGNKIRYGSFATRGAYGWEIARPPPPSKRDGGGGNSSRKATARPQK